MRLPPFGKQFEPVPASGVRVVFGPDAWNIAKRYYYPIMVFPDGEPASAFTWPSNGLAALVFELGESDDERLTELSRELLIAGASSVVSLRTAYADFGGSRDPRLFFDRAANNVAA